MKLKRIRAIYPLIVAILAGTGGAAWAQQVARFPVVSLTAGMHIIKAEFASKEAERQQGLMFRKKMGNNEGMVFLFDAPGNVCMWMKNTLIPLSIAYIDSDGRIVDLQDMKPLDDDPPHYVSAEPAQYALEVNQGFFEEHGVKVGDRADLPV